MLKAGLFLTESSRCTKFELMKVSTFPKTFSHEKWISNPDTKDKVNLQGFHVLVIADILLSTVLF